jgi:hypothetical protein
MPGQNLGGFPAYKAKVAISRGHIVILTTVADEVDLPAGTNSAMCLGYALNDAAIGEFVAVHLLSMGGQAKGIAGGTIAIGDYLVNNSTTGKVTKLTLGASNQFCVGKAVQAGADGQLIAISVSDFIAQGA